MRKLRLDVNALVVESFGTAAAGGAGTVHGARAVLDGAVPGGSGGSDCDICWSADPCTNIPIENLHLRLRHDDPRAAARPPGRAPRARDGVRGHVRLHLYAHRNLLVRARLLLRKRPSHGVNGLTVRTKPLTPRGRSGSRL